MIDHFDEDKLCLQLGVLSERHRIAFAASCCERMLPNYDAFAAMERWGAQQGCGEHWTKCGIISWRSRYLRQS
jgi:hypothetical protein